MKDVKHIIYYNKKKFYQISISFRIWFIYIYKAQIEVSNNNNYTKLQIIKLLQISIFPGEFEA